MKRLLWADFRRDDGGAALVIALIIVTVVAISLGALLTLADTSIRATVNLRAEASTAYEADGALQVAVNNIRNSTVNGQSGQTCFNGNNTLQLNNFNGNDSAAVTCSFDPASVEIQCTSLTQCNRPGNAILTLGTTPGEDGINITQPSSGSNFLVHGTIFSNSNINVVKGDLTTNTAVYARGTCSGTIQSVPSPPSCNYGNTVNALGKDPGYLPVTSTVPAHQPVPSCAQNPVTFLPGYYDDAVGLSKLMSGSGSCKGMTYWFKPGAYYFDFHNGGTDPNPQLSGGSDVWTMNDGYLIAGSPVVTLPLGPNSTSIPGACDNPINDNKAQGVQFIFGGDSQFVIKSGQAEICGTYDPGKPPVAVYGLASGTATSVSLNGTNTLTASSVSSTTGFTSPAATTLATPDGQGATWTTKSSNSQSGSVTTAGFAPPSAIPAGSILKSAILHVVHGNTAGASQDTRTVQLTPTGGTPFSVPVPPAGDSLVHSDAIDITGQLIQSITGTYTGGQMTYTTTVKHAGTELLDALQLDLTYEPPAFRKEDGCTVTGPYTGVGNSTTCAVVTSQNNSGNKFYVQGTTYTPTAVLDITLNNVAAEIFRFGVISRSLWVKLTGSFGYTGPVIEVPDDTPGFVFSVFLSAYVCPGKPTCGNGGNPIVSARVAYVDGDPNNPISGHRQVSVLSWSGAR